MIHRLGILLAFATIALQIAVFLQPLLLEEYQISPACATVLLLSTQIKQKLHLHSEQVLHTDHHSLHLDQPQADSHSEQHHHDLNHQCPFCFFYGHLVAPPTLGIKEVFVRVQVRYLHLYQVFIGFFFSLQRLFLIPQGRAPPSKFSMYSFI